MSRRAVNTFRDHAERTYPWIVDVVVPPSGLGSRINRMGEWCRDRPCRYEAYGYMLRRPCEIPIDLYRFFFMEKTDGAAFAAAWGGQVVDNPSCWPRNRVS